MKKIFKNNKGFTLIELLAVIVVLAIVMVLAVTTVLPYMNKARSDAFAVEAASAIKAASNEMTLIAIGTHSNGDSNLKTDDKANYQKTSDGYCFSLKKLVELGWWDKSDKSLKANGGDYEGYVYVKIDNNTNNHNYSYKVKMHNASFYVESQRSDISGDEVHEYSTEGNFDCSSATYDLTITK